LFCDHFYWENAGCAKPFSGSEFMENGSLQSTLNSLHKSLTLKKTIKEINI